jgi:hypothetical protein
MFFCNKLQKKKAEELVEFFCEKPPPSRKSKLMSGTTHK